MINREQIWDSTLKGLLNYSPAELIKGEININFENEEGIDAGGLKREWLTLLSKEIFNPENGLFKLSENKISYQPNPTSYIIPNHLTQFRILGRLIAKCLIERYDFEVFFVKSFLKHILSIFLL